MLSETLDIMVEGIRLKGEIIVPDEVRGLVIFSHGSGSSQQSPRNKYVAESLQKRGIATLLFDLLTPYEDTDEERRFDIDLQTNRLGSVTQWLTKKTEFKNMNVGYFGASTGAASALRAAVALGPQKIMAVVSRGGRPDLAADVLPNVKSPTLLLVGGMDTEVVELNEAAFEMLRCTKRLTVIPGATHLFEEEGKLEEVTNYAAEWFLKYLYRNPKEVDKDFID